MLAARRPQAPVLALASAFWLAASPLAADDPLRTFDTDLTETYRHAGSPAFSLRYVYEWQEQEELPAGQVFGAGASLRVPSVSVFVQERPPVPLEQAAMLAAKQLERLGRDIRVVRSGRERLADGTEVGVGEVHWIGSVGKGVRLRSLLVSAFAGKRWVLVNVTGGGHSGAFPKSLTGVAYSLRFDGESGDSH